MILLSLVSMPAFSAQGSQATTQNFDQLQQESQNADQQQNKANHINVHHAWVRPGKAGGNTAVYFNITTDLEGVRLIEATCSIAEKTEIHTHINDDGIMRMRQVEALDCPKGDTVLKPGADHVMLMSLKEDLEVDVDRSVPVTLLFSNGTTLLIEAPVKKP